MNFRSSRREMVPGVVPASGGVLADDACRYLAGSPPSSATRVEKPQPGFSVDRGWVRSGTPHFRNSETVRAPDAKAIRGLRACDGALTFEWRFYREETVHRLEGLTGIDYQGRHATLRPADPPIPRRSMRAPQPSDMCPGMLEKPALCTGCHGGCRCAGGRSRRKPDTVPRKINALGRVQ